VKVIAATYNNKQGDESMNILVIYGSVRTERQGIKAARYMVKKLSERGHTVDLIDPLEYSFPLLDWMYKEYEPGKAPEPMEKLAGKIQNADGFIIVSGEYNHSIPPALTNLMDHFLEEYFFRPSGIVCYSAGRFGGVRAAMQLRAFLGEMGMPTISSLLPFGAVQDAFDDEGNPLMDHIDPSTEPFLDEFEWYVKALGDARDKYGTPF